LPPETAIVYLASADDLGAATRALSGVPVVVRAIAAARSAGVEAVIVPDVLRTPAVAHALAARPALDTAVRWVATRATLPAAAALLVPALAFVTVDDLRRLLAMPAPAVLATPEDSGVVFMTAPAAVVTDLAPALVAGLPVISELLRIAKDLEPCPGHGGAAGVWTATSPSLPDDSGTAIDTALDRVVHRRLSRPISRAAVAWGIPANAVTLASLALGLGAVAGFWRATPRSAALGLALYAASVVLDHADGEVARLTLSQSRLGEWLDLTNDTVVHALLVVAVGLTVGQAWPGGTVFGILGALGVVASAALTKMAAPAPGRLGAVLNRLGTRDGFYGTLIVFVTLLAAAPAALGWFLVIVALGSHAYWVGRLVLAALARRHERVRVAGPGRR
jgi:phosphatidylglycerophosphate synthase